MCLCTCRHTCAQGWGWGSDESGEDFACLTFVLNCAGISVTLWKKTKYVYRYSQNELYLPSLSFPQLRVSDKILSINGDQSLLYGPLFIWKANIKFTARVKQ